MDNHPARNSAQLSTNLSATSLREMPLSTCQTAIRLPFSPDRALERTQVVLSLYFQPDEDDTTRAMVRQEFVAALSAYPDWAVQQAFDQWVRTATRRPSPGEIVILAGRAIEPFTDEITRREKQARLENQAPHEVRGDRVSKEAAAAIMDAAGFRPKRMVAE